MKSSCIPLIAVVAVLSAADKHHHQWQDGRVLDVEHILTSRIRRAVRCKAKGRRPARRTTEANGNASTTSIAVYNTYQKYAIEADRYVYLVEERIHFAVEISQDSVNGNEVRRGKESST